jgi:hypothetical protein
MVQSGRHLEYLQYEATAVSVNKPMHYRQLTASDFSQPLHNQLAVFGNQPPYLIQAHFRIAL